MARAVTEVHGDSVKLFFPQMLPYFRNHFALGVFHLFKQRVSEPG